MRSRTSLVIVTAIISAVATSLLWVGGIGLVYWFFLRDAPPFAIQIEAPQEAKVGETITLTAQVSNPTDRRLELGSIDVYDSLLDGFTVAEVNPKPNEQNHSFNFLTLYYSKSLAPGEAFSVSFHLDAKKPGIWTGDVDFCTPTEKFVTSSVTIRVRTEQEAGNGSAERRN